MRRLVAVFQGKRSDKSDAGSSVSNGRSDRSQATTVSNPSQTTAKSRSGFFRSLSKGSSSQLDAKGRKHAMPPVSTLPDHVGSSASSSSGGPRTPSDDHESAVHIGQGRRSWLAQMSDTSLSVVPSKPMSRSYLPQQFSRESDQASETSSESDDADEQETQPPTSLSQGSPSLPIAPTVYFRSITENALRPPFYPPPLLHVPNAPLFPRSCNSSRQLPPSDSLYARVLRKRLLGRLDSQHEGELKGFASRTRTPQRRSLVLDDIAIPKTARVLPTSPGLRRWIERPCFEDRLVVLLPAEVNGDELRCERVSASAAVEALGYSEVLETLAGFTDDITSPPPPGTAEPQSAPPTPLFSLTSSSSSLSSAPPSPAQPLPSPASPSPPAVTSKVLPNAPYKATPSPLRQDSSDTVPEVLPHSSLRPTIVSVATGSSRSSSVDPPSPAVSPKPAVRFADDDKDDIPLDYVMRVKQAKDKKARFLAAERARRLSQQERINTPRYAPADAVREDARRLAEQRKQVEEQRRLLAEERRKLEKERLAAEEQRKKQQYAEELVEARRRQEKTRQGSATRLGEGMSWEGDRERERERRGSDTRTQYTRPRYDSLQSNPSPPRQSSEPNIRMGGSPSSSHLPVHYADSSPGSSRPPSIATGSVRGSSRPPSMYSTPPSSASATDVRSRRESKASRRSFVSDGSYSPSMYYPQGPPGGYPWGAVPPVPALPVNMGNMGNMNMMPVVMPMMQVPVMPYTDMPLLPPTPPFVLQQYGPRSPSGSSRSHSSSPSRGHSSDQHKRHSSGADAAPSSHRRTPSDDVSSRGRNRPPSAYTPAQPSSSSSRSSRPAMPIAQSQSYTSAPPPPMTSSWPKQPAFQNLSRPSSNRRQTMIT